MEELHSNLENGNMDSKKLIGLMALVGTALGATLIKLGRYGDKVGAGQYKVDTDGRDFIVKYRADSTEEFQVLMSDSSKPHEALRTRGEATSIANSLRASIQNVEVKVFNLRTNQEVEI